MTLLVSSRRIGAASLAGEHAKDGPGAVGLHRIRDEVRYVLERGLGTGVPDEQERQHIPLSRDEAVLDDGQRWEVR